MNKFTLMCATLSTALLIQCASSNAVDPGEPKRLLGRESDVRIDAQISSDNLAPSIAVGVAYEVENLRPQAIAIAELIPETAYDSETRTITLSFGSEVPGNEIVPRLVVINSGEKKAFTAGARVDFKVLLDPTVRQTYPQYLRIKVNFLGDVEPFRALVGIPERAIRDARLANELFPKWIENNDSVITNAIPIVWGPARSIFPEARRR